MSSKTKLAIAFVGVVALGYFFLLPELKKSSGLM
jgi:hypothetical protein